MLRIHEMNEYRYHNVCDRRVLASIVSLTDVKDQPLDQAFVSVA